MVIYVDQLFNTPQTIKWRYDQACHLMADSLHELYCCATIIELNLNWVQDSDGLPHFDLTANKRKELLENCRGVIELEHGMESVKIVRELRDRYKKMEKNNG